MPTGWSGYLVATVDTRVSMRYVLGMDVEKIAQALADELRAEAAARRISIADLAARAGISRPSAYRYTDGSRDIPLPAFFAMCEALSVRPDEIMRRAEERARRDVEDGGDVQ